jgi:hypothetical protein
LKSGWSCAIAIPGQLRRVHKRRRIRPKLRPIAMQDTPPRRELRTTCEWIPFGQYGVHRHPERKDIDLEGIRQFRRPINRSPDSIGCITLRPTRQPSIRATEVTDPSFMITFNQNIAWIQVSMDQPAFVQSRNPAGPPKRIITFAGNVHQSGV